MDESGARHAIAHYVSAMTPESMVLDLRAMRWDAVDDRVMGGTSSSHATVTPERHLIFSGTVSPENGGGFASIRTPVRPCDFSGSLGFSLTVRGDGKRYRLTARTGPDPASVQYQAAFIARQNQIAKVWLPFESFVPRFRGRDAPAAGPLKRERICLLGLMIADGLFGNFRLECLGMETRTQIPV